jgi:hypothetical protein
MASKRPSRRPSLAPKAGGADKGEATEIALARIFATDEGTQDDLIAFCFDMGGLIERARSLAERADSRKLAQIAQIMAALETCLMQDNASRALDAAESWANHYFDSVKERAAVKVSNQLVVLQNRARLMLDRLETMKGESASRGDAATMLAFEVEQALSLFAAASPDALQRSRAELAAKIRRGIDKRDGRSDTFVRDLEQTVVSAFKVGGLARDLANHLFEEPPSRRRKPPR